MGNSPARRFCGECGARLALACPACGFANEPVARFCGGCGVLLGEPAPAAAPRFGSPDAYTPRHLAEKILTARSALEGERKQVTVLFADLKGSMELLADRDPEEARRLLDPVLERMMEAVHRYEGTVNQVMGDGVMALFGAPLAHEDHAVRACYAALRMQDSVKRYADDARRSAGVAVAIRVGLNSGDVVVRAIGSDLHMDYTAVGQTTHLAARMEQLASPGGILLTSDTLRLAEGYVDVKPLGPVPVKGLETPVAVFEMLGAGPVRSRLQAAAARGFTPFVGREVEMEQLGRALDLARAGHGQVVGVVGEAGVGKSRLFWEFTRSYRIRGWLVVESPSVSYGGATPYLPVIELLRTYFELEARDDAQRVREKITGRLFSLDRTLEPFLPAFFELLDGGGDDTQWKALEPPQRRQRTLDAIKRLLLRESQRQPLVLVFEDLHWIDSETQALLDSLVESLPTTRILLLVNYRPEYQHPWGGKTYYRQLRIDPLAPESADELLNGLLGADAELAPLKRLLIERTEGNPFFLEESIRTLVETSVLAGAPGAYRRVRSTLEIQIPSTAQAILAARIDRLPPDDKRLLQEASVIGKNVPLALLQAVVERPEEELRRSLAHLQAAEFLYETSLFPDLEYTFKHALTHEVAYGGLLHEQRRALHSRIVEAIEGLHGDRTAEQIERLAQHALRGEVWDRAVAYLHRAGLNAFQRSANREAAAYFEQALDALGHLPEGRETLAAAIDLRLDLRNALFPLGEQARIAQCLREALTLSEALGDQPRLGRVHSYLVNYFLGVGEHESARAAGESALAIAETLDDADLKLSTLFHLGQLHASRGDYGRAADCNRRNLEFIEGSPASARLGGSALLVLSRTWLAWCLAELGEFAEGFARAEQRLHAARTAGEPFELVTASLGLGLLHLRRGNAQDAIEVLDRALDHCRSGNLSVWFSAVASPLGYAHALSGRADEAVALLEEAVGETTSRRGGHALRLAHLAEAYLLAGRLEEATSLAARALELARERNELGHEAYALRSVAEVAAQREPAAVNRAADDYRRAIARAAELGMRPLLARCRLALGELHLKRGSLEEARRELAAAMELLTAMDMRRWIGQAEAALTALDPSPPRSGRTGSGRSRSAP
ncbi:MAG: AAA family ATPase [Candidatus Rokubacteria bacterium]|nr:AAA family ATPase [Candidatus Rokubacteria bacterium]